MGYGFLNFPSFIDAASGASGLLAWSSLGWVALKLGERDVIDVKLFGTGKEEWEFNEVAVRIMPAFINKLAELRSAIDAQIRRTEGVEAKILALFMSSSIVLLQWLSKAVVYHVSH